MNWKIITYRKIWYLHIIFGHIRFDIRKGGSFHFNIFSKLFFTSLSHEHLFTWDHSYPSLYHLTFEESPKRSSNVQGVHKTNLVNGFKLLKCFWCLWHFKRPRGKDFFKPNQTIFWVILGKLNKKAQIDRVSTKNIYMVLRWEGESKQILLEWDPVKIYHRSCQLDYKWKMLNQ